MSNKFNFQKLTPMNDADLSVYQEAMDFVFKNEDIKNIAVSGAYSSGKSSILESYKRKHSDKRFIHLSLAHFNTLEQDDISSLNSVNVNGSDVANDLVKESVIEGKILNQLIHQIPSKKIPQTNFRVKKDVKLFNVLIWTAIFSMAIGSVAYLATYEKIRTFIIQMSDSWLKSILFGLASQYTVIIAVGICAICTFTAILLLIKAQSNRSILRKISLQGNDIEIFEETDDSYFDKYLNEVLYLFENVEADVIVFEDMDRLNASRIFQRLREVNTLVNIHRKKEQHEKYSPLRFFYLLRDDIFTSKDRTKFFDYIIPIIPVVDGSNSYEQFLKHLSEGGLLDKFDHSFLQSLSLYVDDMRILKNIYNEFLVYFYRLNTTDLNYNKMLALITYKNLFPRDFNDLQLAKGFIYKLFTEKEILIEKELILIKSQRDLLVLRIESAKNEFLLDQQEIEDVYAAKKLRIPKPYGHYDQNGQALINQYDIELEERKQALQDRSETQLSNLETELAGLDNRISIVKTKLLKDLINRENIDSVFSVTHKDEIGSINEFKEIKKSDYFSLLKFLIRNGFIDETYTDYMTYFYDDSISANDKTFLRRITDRRGSEYTYALREPKKIIESPLMRRVEFEQEEVLNFDLFEYLLQFNDAEKNQAYLQTLILQVQRTSNFDFMSKYYDTGKSRKQFVCNVNSIWSGFFSEALIQMAIPLKQIRLFSIETLYYSDDEVIESVNYDNNLTKYISACADYLAIENPDIERLITGFKHLGVQFNDLNYDSADKNLFEEVYKNHLYELNFTNICLMLKKVYQIECEFDMFSRNYSLIQTQNSSPLASYVSQNMAAYVSILLENCADEINDDRENAISLLNNTQVDKVLKDKYIDLLTTTISNISEITETSLWIGLLNRGIIEFSMNNIVNYFEIFSLDRALIEFINSDSTEIDFASTHDTFGEETAKQLFDHISICNEIASVKYKDALLSLKYNFDNYEVVNIDDDKFKILIDEKILKMGADCLKFVREKYAHFTIPFIIHNIDDYIELQSPEITSHEEILEILMLNIGDDKKNKLLSNTIEPISVINKAYSDELIAYLLTRNLCFEDKPSLYENYSKYEHLTQAVISSLTLNGVDEIILNDWKLEDSLLSQLLKSENIVRDKKITLFTKAIPELNEDTCKVHFEELGLEDLSGIFTKGGSRRKYIRNDEVRIVLEALKENNWIYDYKEDDKNNERYLITKIMPKLKSSEFID